MKQATELEVALVDLQQLLDGRVNQLGGYPAVVEVLGSWIVIADVDHDDAPELTILRLDKFLDLWRFATANLLRTGEGTIVEHLYEAGYPEECMRAAE